MSHDFCLLSSRSPLSKSPDLPTDGPICLPLLPMQRHTDRSPGRHAHASARPHIFAFPSFSRPHDAASASSSLIIITMIANDDVCMAVRETSCLVRAVHHPARDSFDQLWNQTIDDEDHFVDQTIAFALSPRPPGPMNQPADQWSVKSVLLPHGGTPSYTFRRLLSKQNAPPAAALAFNSCVRLERSCRWSLGLNAANFHIFSSLSSYRLEAGDVHSLVHSLTYSVRLTNGSEKNVLLPNTWRTRVLHAS